jgi:predicted secreted protein
MDFVSGIVVYILLWWWVFLMSLSFGVRVPTEVAKGHATSAPEKPMLWRKVAITTLIAAGLFVIVYLIIDSGVISFRTP